MAVPNIHEGRITYTLQETAAMLGVHRDTILRMLADGQLVKIKVRSRTLVRADSLHDLLNQSK